MRRDPEKRGIGTQGFRKEQEHQGRPECQDLSLEDRVQRSVESILS